MMNQNKMTARDTADQEMILWTSAHVRWNTEGKLSMILNLPGTQNITVLVFIPVFIYLKTSGKVATSGGSF